MLEKLLGEFERRQIRYALTGGFAMGLWGVGQVTVDIDFLVLDQYVKLLDMEELWDEILEGLRN